MCIDLGQQRSVLVLQEESEMKQLETEQNAREKHQKLMNDMQDSWREQLSQRGIQEDALQKEMSKHAEEVSGINASQL